VVTNLLTLHSCDSCELPIEKASLQTGGCPQNSIYTLITVYPEISAVRLFHSCAICQDFRVLNFMVLLSPGFFTVLNFTDC